jgi:alpha-tubulin suppressor-like RCC1 family protein
MGCRRSPGPEVKLPRSAVQVAAGKTHACALLDDGSVHCWGENTFGQLGSRRSERCPGPRTVKNSCLDHAVAVEQLGGKAREIRAGNHFTCALLESGEVRCWGIGLLGQLGTAEAGLCVEPITEKRNIACSPRPLKIEGLPRRARSIAVGEAHACALLENNEAWCWGGNLYGELGDETVKSRPTPAPVKYLGPNVEQLSVSLRRSCALVTGNRVFCWPQPRLPGASGH